MDDFWSSLFLKSTKQNAPTHKAPQKNSAAHLTLRELGNFDRLHGPPKELQWAAEDSLIDVNRIYAESVCDLPDSTRSTFLMVFSPDGKLIASTHGDHNVYITDLIKGKLVRTLKGHPRTPWCIAFHPSFNQILASGCLGGHVRVWDLHGGSEVWIAENQTVIASLAFHPVHRILAIGSYNEIHFWDWSKEKPFAKCTTANDKEKVRYVAFDEGGCKLITGIANVGPRRSEWDRMWPPTFVRPPSPPQATQIPPPPRPPPPAITDNNSTYSRITTFCYRYMLARYEQLMRRYRELARRGASLSSNEVLRGEDEPSRSNLSAGTDELTASLSSSRNLESRRSVGSTARNPRPLPNMNVQPQELLSSSNNSAELLERLGELRAYIQAAWVQAMVEMQDSSANGEAALRDESIADLSRLMADIPGSNSSATSFQAAPSQQAAQQNDSGSDTPSGNRTGAAARLADVLASGLRRLREINRQLRTLELGGSRPSGTNAAGSQTSSSQTSLATSSSEYNTLRMVEEYLLQRIEEQEQVIESDIQRVRQFNSRILAPGREEGSLFGLLRTQPRSEPFQPTSSADSIQILNEPEVMGRSQVGSSASERAERRLFVRLNYLMRPSERLSLRLPEERLRLRLPEERLRIPEERLRLLEERPEGEGSLEEEQDGGQGSRSNNEPLGADLGNMRLGMQLLSRHIDNMSRLCRVRFEVVQLRQVRQMWDELQRSLSDFQNAVTSSTESHRYSGLVSPLLSDAASDRTNGEAAAPRRLGSDSVASSVSNPGVRWSSVAETSDSSSVATSDSFHTPRRSVFSPYVQNRAGAPGTPRPSTSREMPQSSTTPATSSSGIDSEGDCSSGSSSRPPLLSFRRSARSSASKRARYESVFRPAAHSSQSLAAGYHRRGAGRMIFGSTPRLGRFRSNRIIAEMFYRQARSTGTTDEGSDDDDDNEGGNTSSSNGAVAAAIISQSRRKRTRPSAPSLQAISSQPAHDGGRSVSGRMGSSYQMPRLRAGCSRFYRHRATPSFLPQRVMHRPSFYRPANTNTTRDFSSQTPPFLIDASVGTDPDVDDSELGTATGRLRARQALLQMIESLMDFLENDTFTRNLPTETLHRRIICLYNLLQRALELTQTLIVQMMPLSRNEEESSSFVRSSAGPSREESSEGSTSAFRTLSSWLDQRRSARRSSSSAQVNSSTSSHETSSSSSGSESVRRIPTLRVNDAPLPADYVAPPPLPREPPPPPPPISRQPRARMFRLSPVDDSGDDSSPAPVYIDSSFYVRLISDHNMRLTHRIQAWDFRNCDIPEISNSQINVVVSECRVHNDASVDISKDGKLLVALLPSTSMAPSNNTNMLGIYSLEWGTLGQCLYRTVCLQNAVSVSLSPTSRHLVVGLTSRRSLITLNFPQYLAQVCKLNGGEARVGGEKPGNLLFVREIKFPPESDSFGVNCIRWIPCPGSGFVYGTNTGQLKILR